MAKKTPPLQAHPLAKLFPMIEGAEFDSLVASIKANGLKVPIILWEGKILDGRNRYAACLKAGVEPKFVEHTDPGTLLQTVLALNLDRRSLTSGQRAVIGLEIEPMLAREAKARLAAATAERNKRVAEENRKRKESVAAGEPPPETAEATKAKAKKSPPRPHRAPGAREETAKIVGVGPRIIQDAKMIKKADPKLIDRLRAGEVTMSQAKAEALRRERAKALEAKAKEREAEARAKGADAAVPGNVIVTGDCLAGLAELEAGSARLVFADPPYNLGVDYGRGPKADKLPDEEFAAWVGDWVRACKRVLAEDGSLWLLMSDEYAAECVLAMKGAGFAIRRWVKWFEGFGQNVPNNFNRCTRHLLYGVANPRKFTFNEDAVKRPSDREAKYNDARAMPGGKILDDCWFDIPRLAGTHAERLPDFPTQLPIALVERVIACASDPGDLVIDPFAGSGTTAVACKRMSRRFHGFELNPDYANKARLRVQGDS